MALTDNTQDTTARVFAFAEIPQQEGGLGLSHVNGMPTDTATVAIEGTKIVAQVEPATSIMTADNTFDFTPSMDM
ncbi:MAG: hypothetical protein GW778_01330 [Alphaproteobacteria bacterium]|nr:hypothetical protein [Alphaproteobacteria bacterium]